MKTNIFLGYYVVLPRKSIVDGTIPIRDRDRVGDLISWFNNRWYSKDGIGYFQSQGYGVSKDQLLNQLPETAPNNL